MEELEDELDVQPFSADTVAEYVDEVERLFAAEPDGRKKREHAAWVIKINDVIAETNKMSKLKGNGVKLYHQIK